MAGKIDMNAYQTERAILAHKLKFRVRLRDDILAQLQQNMRDIAEAKRLIREADDMMRTSLKISTKEMTR